MGIEHEVKEQRELIASLMLENAALRNTSAKQETEIERLHGELAALQTHFDIKAKRGDEKDAEIERLNADYALLTDDYTQVVGDTIRLRAKAEQSRQEIERLHKELQETKNWLRVRTETKWHAEDEVERLRMEVEKLRGLLRYWLEGGTDNIDTLEDRVREALGEEEPR